LNSLRPCKQHVEAETPRHLSEPCMPAAAIPRVDAVTGRDGREVVAVR
jgi:hypothetical protein